MEIFLISRPNSSAIERNREFKKLLKERNQNAYIHLVDKYHHELCVYAASLSRDKQSAEDIVQNVFLKLWEQKHKLNNESSYRSFLYQSVYNEFVDQYRKHKKSTIVEDRYLDTLNSLINQKEELDNDELIAIVRNEVQNLPPRCQEMFLLSKKEGLTNSEIAQYLKVSVKAVERQMTKALSQIRKKLLSICL